MKKILLVVLILLCSGFVGINHGTATSSGKEINVWIEVDKISTTIEIDPMNNYYFHIKNDEIEHITQEKIPVMDALKRVPNWLRDDLENNFEKMAYVDIDVGEHAAPTLFDIDNDNDFDLVVGTADGKIIVYENSNNVWIKKGFLNDSNGNPIDVGDYAVPTFFDLYNDGKKDLIVGAYDGRIRYYENTTKGFVYKGYLKDVNGNTIDVGSYSAPAFVDLTSEANQYPGTKHVDLTIGSGDGALYYYENVGYYENEAKWFYKDIYSSINNDVNGYSKPALVDLDDDGDYDLTVGCDDGQLRYYKNTGTSTNPSWTEDDSMYQYFETSAYASPVLADMDKNKLMTDDCLYDIVVGRGDGYIHLYKNVGTSSNAKWDVFPDASESVSHHLQERNLSYLEKYVDLILDVENEYVDEIAFCIAHTSVDVLTDDDVYLDVFKKNAELIYEIDHYIKYANLVEEGNISTGDYWTTIRYNYLQDGEIRNTILPPDIYYWFVVHPKITDEIPTFINPETGRPDESGVFWREYLFYHADENYPSDPDTDTNNDGIPDYYYPKDESPPLLKDKISNVTVMYDNVPYTAPPGYDNHGHYFEDNPRNWNWSYDKGHAVEIVSNWVEKTLPLNEQESDDGERPIQPVRIAHHHNGNCGELQDLTVAAARTCMIPTAGVNLIGEDHVWSEFYCVNESRDYYWHQWDNHWSDSRSVIDQFDDYWVNWGERGGSGIFKWNGDDSITDVSDRYLIDKDGNPVSSVVKVVVNDTDGNPVDGARVIMSSYWLADNEIESITGMTFRFVHYIIPGVAGFSFFPSIWNYTDSEGVAEFRLADNYFVIDVSSKIGSDEKTIYVGENGNYTVSFELDGSVPKPELNTAGDSSPDTPDYNMRLEYEVLNDVQDTKNIIVNTEQIGKRKMANSYIDLFICNKTNMEKYLMGLPFDSGELKIDEIEGLVPFDDDGNMDDDWYIVFSNDKHIETKKIIEITVTIKKKQPSWGTTTTINVSANGFINGTASSFVNITNVEIKVNDGNWVNANLGLYGFVDGNYTVKWNYSLNMSNYYAGECIIYARVIDDEGYIKIVSQEDIIYCPLPTINILHPILGEMVEKTISVSGTASDKTQKNIQKMKMWIKIGDEEWFTADLSPIEGADAEWNWWYNSTDTTTVNDGEQKLYIRAFNGIMYTVASVEVIVDNNLPDVNILSLSENDVVSGSITINGNASDVNSIREIKIGVDGSRKSSYWYEKDWEQKEVIESDLSSDGEYIAAVTCTPCDDNYWHNLSLFQKDSPTPLWTFGYGPSPDKHLPISISSDGSYIVAGGAVFLFKKDSNVPLWTYPTPHVVDRVSISLDGKYIVAGDRAGIIYLFETDSSTPLWIYETEDVVKSVSISVDGNYIVVGTAGSGGGGNGTLYLFDRGNSTPLWSYNMGTWIESTSMSTDGKYIVAGTYDRKVYLFQNNSNTPLWDHTTGGLVGSVSMSSDGKYIVAGGWDGNISFFEKNSGTPLWIYETGGLINYVDISSDGGRIVASGYNIHTGVNTTYVFDNESNSPTWSYKFEDVPYLALLSDDAKYIAVVSHAGNIYRLHFFQEKSLPTGVNVSWAYPFDTTELSEGEHTIYVSAFDGLHYHNITVNITVDNNRPPEIIYSPTKDNIAIKENSTQEFEVLDAVDPEQTATLTYQWYINGDIILGANERVYTFIADYSSSGSYEVKVVVLDDVPEPYPKTRIWNLTVENVNRAPVIESFTPPDSAITMNEGESKTFSLINASDPDGTTPTITWYRYLNGESKGDPKGSGNSYTFYSNYDSAGIYIVKAVVSDGETSISHVWTLTVNDVNQPFTFDSFSPNQTEFEMKKGMAKTFSVNADDPEDSLTIKWYVNGENVGSGDSYTFIPTSYGTYIVSATLSDGEKTETHFWRINVKEPEPTPGFEIMSLLMIFGVLIALRKITKKKNI